jgi:hypothetical protein
MLSVYLTKFTFLIYNSLLNQTKKKHMSILETGIQIPLFNPENFAMKGLVAKLMASPSSNLTANGDVTYEQCDDAAGAFTFDGDNTSNLPAPVVKGSDVTLNLAGIVSETVEVTNVHIHVDWNGSTLYDEDHSQDNTYDSSYSYKLSWSVPSYAPSGSYAIKVTGTGNTASVSNDFVICINANMTL